MKIEIAKSDNSLVQFASLQFTYMPHHSIATGFIIHVKIELILQKLIFFFTSIPPCKRQQSPLRNIAAQRSCERTFMQIDDTYFNKQPANWPARCSGFNQETRFITSTVVIMGAGCRIRVTLDTPTDWLDLLSSAIFPCGHFIQRCRRRYASV